MSVENILDKYLKDGEEGCKWYIPAKDNKKTHYNIKDICINKNMAVFVKNSKGLVLFTPYNRVGKTIKEKNNMCMNDIIVNAINENNLHKYQIVVTGYRCIGRGITLQNEDFMFDYGILINLNDRSSASQLFGRLKGNIKEYNNYEKPTVFIDKVSYKKIKENNSISTQMGILAYYNDKNEASFIDKNTYNLLKKDNKDYYCEIFNSYEEMKDFLKNRNISYNPQKKTDIDENGFYRSHIRGVFKVRNINEIKLERGWGMKSSNCRYYIGYEDTNDTNTAKHILVLKK